MDAKNRLIFQSISQNIHLAPKDIPCTRLYKGNKSVQMSPKFIIFETKGENLINWTEKNGGESQNQGIRTLVNQAYPKH